MKGFALVSWLACAGLTCALYWSPTAPLRAVDQHVGHVTLRSFSLERPEVVNMEKVVPEAPIVQEEAPVEPANALPEPPLPPQAKEAAMTAPAEDDTCRVWGPWTTKDLPRLHSLLGPKGLENGLQILRAASPGEYGVYTIVGRTREAAERRWRALRKDGMEGHSVTHFDGEGWGILFGRHAEESKAQEQAQQLGREKGIKRLNILQFGNRNDVPIELVLRGLTPSTLGWLEKEVKKHHGTSLRACTP